MSIWTFLNTPIGTLLLGFAFTTVAGAIIARRLETGAWKRQTQVELFRRRYDDGCVLLDSLSTLIGARSFALQRLAWALPSGKESRIKQLEAENSRMVAVWNKHRYNYRNKIRLLIGEPQANAFLDYGDDFHPESPGSVHYVRPGASRRHAGAQGHRPREGGAAGAGRAERHVLQLPGVPHQRVRGPRHGAQAAPAPRPAARRGRRGTAGVLRYLRVAEDRAYGPAGTRAQYSIPGESHARGGAALTVRSGSGLPAPPRNRAAGGGVARGVIL